MHQAIDARITLLSTVPNEVMNAEQGAEINPGPQDEAAFLSACVDTHLTLTQGV